MWSFFKLQTLHSQNPKREQRLCKTERGESITTPGGSPDLQTLLILHGLLTRKRCSWCKFYGLTSASAHWRCYFLLRCPFRKRENNFPCRAYFENVTFRVVHVAFFYGEEFKGRDTLLLFTCGEVSLSLYIIVEAQVWSDCVWCVSESYLCKFHAYMFYSFSPATVTATRHVTAPTSSDIDWPQRRIVVLQP